MFQKSFPGLSQVSQPQQPLIHQQLSPSQFSPDQQIQSQPSYQQTQLQSYLPDRPQTPYTSSTLPPSRDITPPQNQELIYELPESPRTPTSSRNLFKTPEKSPSNSNHSSANQQFNPPEIQSLGSTYKRQHRPPNAETSDPSPRKRQNRSSPPKNQKSNSSPNKVTSNTPPVVTANEPPATRLQTKKRSAIESNSIYNVNVINMTA
jgi:hypothetical protein